MNLDSAAADPIGPPESHAHRDDRTGGESATAVMPRPGAHVLIATLNRPTGATGVHTHTRVLSEGLHEIGIDCEVVTPYSGSGAWKLPFAVRPLVLKHINGSLSTLWYRHWHMAALRTNLRGAFARQVPSSVIAQCPPSARVAMHVVAEAGLRESVEVTLVCHFNGSEAKEYRDLGVLSGRAFDRVLRDEERTLCAVDRVIYVSEWSRQTVEEDRGIRTRSRGVIWNGITQDAPPAQVLSRAAIGVGADDLVLMNVGTLEPRKDQLGLVRLFAKCLGEFPAARLVLVGEGGDRTAIERLARETGVASRVTLLGHRSDVPDLLGLADVYIHYAAAENCPIVLLEAARASLPWAAKPVGGIRELIGMLGGIALSDDAEDPIAPLCDLLRHKQVRDRLGSDARRHFLEHFTQRAMVRRYVDTLHLVRSGGG